MIEKEVQRARGAAAGRRGHLQPAQGGHAARDRRDDSLRARHPADAGDPARSSSTPTTRTTRASCPGCRRRRSRTRGSPRCRRPRTRPRSTTSSSSASRTAGATSSRPARQEFDNYSRAGAAIADGGRPGSSACSEIPSRTRSRRGCRTPPSRRAGLDWAYVPLPVEPEDLEDAVAGLSALGFAGANVTIPHKSAIVSFCDELDEVAERAASVNTLVVRDGRVLGSSTDGLAVTGAVDAEGARVLVLGAGGAAVAVAVALLDAGARRCHRGGARPGPRAGAGGATARALPGRRGRGARLRGLPSRAAPRSSSTRRRCRDELPVEPRAGQAGRRPRLPPRTALPTALVAAARKAGCDPVVDGLEVLVRQGAASFERWTGVTAPVDVMRFAISEGEHARTETKREE